MNRTLGQNENRGIVIAIDYSSGVPLYRQIIQQIEYGILSGRLQNGDKLPTIRSLAVMLKINPNTIARVYKELEIRGIVVTQIGSGTFISDKKPDTASDGREEKIRLCIERFLRDMVDLGVSKDEIKAKIIKKMEES